MRRRPNSGITDHRWIVSNLLKSRIPLSSLIQTLAVAEYLNFRHAANALGISQSSVSARVKALEENLGVLLFERHARGVRLTEAGRHFVERVTFGIDHLDYAVQTAGMVARGDHGRLRIGTHALVPGGFLASLIERYRELHSGISVEISEGTARDTVMQIRSNKLDLTFVAGLPDLPDCHSRPIWRERLVAVVPSNHPLASREGITWTDLLEEIFIVRVGGTGAQVFDHVVMRLSKRAPDLWILRFDVELSTLLLMVAQGYGVTIAGEATAQFHIPGIKFLPMVDELTPYPFSAIWSPHNRSRALMDLLQLAGRMKQSV